MGEFSEFHFVAIMFSKGSQKKKFFPTKRRGGDVKAGPLRKNNSI